MIQKRPEPGNILVNLSKEENAVILAVQDFGIGIPREHQAKIFERYYPVGSTTENAFPGLGMGLYISTDARACGADDFVPKPFKMGDLLAKIVKYL